MITHKDIDQSNFNEHFFNVRDHQPKAGQVIACFRAICELINGEEKQFLIKTLQRPNAAESASNIMSKLFYANKESSWHTPMEMAQDLLDGMSEDEVAQKPYEFVAEFFYYTQRECVPSDDPQWEIIEIIRPQIKTESDLYPKTTQEIGEVTGLMVENIPTIVEDPDLLS